MKNSTMIICAGVLLASLPALVGCSSSRVASQAKDTDEYEYVSVTGSITPRRVKKGQKLHDRIAIESANGQTTADMERRAMTSQHATQQTTSGGSLVGP